MKISKIIKKITNKPKQFLALSLIAATASVSVIGVVSAANQVLMEGNTQVLNVTAGETTYKDETSAKVDEVVQVQLWQHNRELPDGEKAKNTKVRFDVPTTPGKTQIITGTTTVENGNNISDTTKVNLSLDKARLEYIPGTAKFKYNKGAADGRAECKTGMAFPPQNCFATIKISDNVVNGGVNLDQYRGGPLNGCNAYHETVTIQLRSVADVVSVNKMVRHEGSGSAGWSTSINAKPGDSIEYLIKFKNEGNTKLNNVLVADNLPKYNAYVPGSTMLQNSNHPSGISISNDGVTTGGINVGNYGSGASAYVWFKVKLDDIHAYEKCGVYDIRNVGIVKPQDMNQYYNTAQVKIQVDCEDKPTPKYACDLLTATKTGNGREVKFSVSASASGGATVQDYVYNFGDGNTVTSANNMVTHTYSQDGSYNAYVTVRVMVDGKVKETTSEACKAHIKFESNPDYELEKGVRIAGSNSGYMQDVTVEYGDTVEYQIAIKNTGDTKIGTISVKDVAPLGVEYIQGSLKVTGVDSIAGDLLDGNGMLLNGLDVGGTAYITYKAKVVRIDDVSCDLKNYRNVAKTHVANIGSKEDDANVKASCDEPNPEYQCTDLVATKTGNGREVKFTASASASGGAEIKRYVYSFGDGSEDLTTDNTMVKHTYPNDGQYAARVAVQVSVNGEMKTADGDQCATSVSFNTPVTPETPVTPVTPGKLPDTGAGSIVATFLGVVVASSMAYSFVRRFVQI